MGSLKPNDPGVFYFSIRGTGTGQIDPDGAVTASMYRNAAVDNAVSVTVASAGLGEEKVTWTYPNTYASGDSCQVRVSFSSGGLPYVYWSPLVVLDSKRNSDLQDISSSTVGTACAGSVLSSPSHPIANDSSGYVMISTNAVTSIWSYATGSIGTSGSIGKLIVDNLNAQISTLATSLTTILNRIGGFTGSGINNIFGFFLALAKKDADVPSDMGGTFASSSDSLEAHQDQVAAVDGTVGMIEQVVMADRYIDTTNAAQWQLVLMVAGSGAPGVGTEVARYDLKDQNGAAITSTSNPTTTPAALLGQSITA